MSLLSVYLSTIYFPTIYQPSITLSSLNNYLASFLTIPIHIYLPINFLSKYLPYFSTNVLNTISIFFYHLIYLYNHQPVPLSKQLPIYLSTKQSISSSIHLSVYLHSSISFSYRSTPPLHLPFSFPHPVLKNNDEVNILAEYPLSP